MTQHYAVVKNGHPVVGSGVWAAPSQTSRGEWIPGVWTHWNRPLDIYYGPTLVDDPIPFLEPGCTIYVAEGRGDRVHRHGRYAYQQSRLLRPAPEMIPRWWIATEHFLDDILGVSFLSAKDAGEYTVYDPDVHTGVTAAIERDHRAIMRHCFTLEPQGRLYANVIRWIGEAVRQRLDALRVSRIYTSRIIDDATSYWLTSVANDLGHDNDGPLANARAYWLAWCDGQAVVGGTETVVVYDPPFSPLPESNPPSRQPALI